MVQTKYYFHNKIPSLNVRKVPLEVRGTFLELRKCPCFLNIPKQCSLNVAVERLKGILREPSTGIFQRIFAENVPRTFHRNIQRAFLANFDRTFCGSIQPTFAEYFPGTFRGNIQGTFFGNVSGIICCSIQGTFLINNSAAIPHECSCEKFYECSLEMLAERFYGSFHEHYL